MKVAVFDAETDGLVSTKIHCLCANVEGKELSTTNYERMKQFLTTYDILIGHNIQRFDIPQLEKVLGITIKAKLVDTLALSWYLEPKRVKHGLEFWGEEFGVAKPVITDWENQTIEDYLHRCGEDVKINTKLWDRFWKHLLRIYGTEEKAWKLIDYLEFKLDCAREQERSKWKIDLPFTQEKFEELTIAKEIKTAELGEAMPMVDVTAKRTKPAKPFKKDGTLSAAGTRWKELLERNNLPPTYSGVVEEVTGSKKPNPNSPDQIKSWLYSLGWVPATHKFDRNKKTGVTKNIPQISLPHGGGICESIKILYEKEPSLELLDGLAVISHRISILKGFLANVDDDGCIKAEIQGFTNTLRFKHKVAVNLPGIDKPYGKYIRGCLIAPEGYELCGSDQAALEDRTKQHFMWEYDPDYVRKQMAPGYCPHIDIASLAKYVTPEEEERHRTKSFLNDEDKKHILSMRKKAKPVNYGGVYGQMPEGLSRSSGMPLADAERLHRIYWERNWSVKSIAEAQVVKTVAGQKWLFNPVSELWYSLRKEKDRFSTLNQGTGTYCFDMWVMEIRRRRPQLTAQFHDEIVLCVKKGCRDQAVKLLKEAVQAVNNQLKLNRELDVDVQFGNKYSEIH